MIKQNYIKRLFSTDNSFIIVLLILKKEVLCIGGLTIGS